MKKTSGQEGRDEIAERFSGTRRGAERRDYYPSELAALDAKLNRKSLTKEYFETLGEVYKEQGLLAAAGYEIASTWKHIINGLTNIFEPDTDNPEYVNSRRWPENSIGREKQKQAYRNIANRDEETREYLLRGKKKGLQGKAVATASIIGILGGIFFLSGNFTGNVIGSANQTSANFSGVILFVIGLVGAFAYFKRR